MQTATNPQTGEKLVLQGGQWVPAGNAAPSAPMGAPAPMTFGTPRPPDPFKVRDQQLQEEAAGRAREDQQFQRDQANRQATKDTTVNQGQNIDREITVRKEFEGLNQVQQYHTILPLFASAVKAGDNGAGDLNIIYALGKVMDPTSAVREGELEMASTTGSAGEQVKGYFQQVSRGGRLTPVVRKQLLDELRSRTGGIADSYNSARENYKRLAERYGMDPTGVVGEHPGKPFQQAEADFLGRPVRNLDGGMGAQPNGLPRANPIDAPRTGDIGFNTPDQPEPMGRQLTPEQQAAYDALVGSGADGATIQRFFSGIGFNIENAGDVVGARDKGAGFVRAEGAKYNVPEETQRLKDARDKQEGRAGGDDLFLQGAQLGLGDEASGIGNALANTVSAPFTDQQFDPVGAYQSGRDAERLRLDEARQGAGVGGTIAEIGGSLVSGNASGALKAAPTLIGRMAQGAKAGAVGGGAAGFGYGEGPSSLLSALGGATAGAAIGGALPVAGTVIGNRLEGARRLTGKDPTLPRRMVSEALDADGNAPAVAGRTMDEARTRGSPMMLGDTGDNARELMASVGRQPGESRTIVRNAVGERQNAQTERIGDAVVRDLGPTANIREMGDSLIEKARAAAGPLYDKAYSASGVSSVKLDDLALRPSFRKALRNAANTAAEEGTDGAALGFQFNEAGDVVLDRVPSWQTLDYVKRGLDDVVEGYRDSTTGKLNLNTSEARATEATRRSLIARMDKINPNYKAARDAYSGPAKMRDALEKGAKALNRRPDDIVAMMKGMGPGEQESFRLGIRKAIVDMLGSKKDGGDKVAALIGTPNSRAALTRVFGGKAEFQRFIATLRDEEVMGRTYKSVFGNSATAGRSAQDAQSVDEGLAEGVVDSALRGETLWASAVRAFQKLREVERFGAGEAGQRVRKGVAALLSETDPAVLRELIAAASHAAKTQTARGVTRSKNAVRVGRNAGNVAGMGAGSFTKE